MRKKNKNKVVEEIKEEVVLEAVVTEEVAEAPVITPEVEEMFNEELPTLEEVEKELEAPTEEVAYVAPEFINDPIEILIKGDLSGLENDGSPQYPLSDETEEVVVEKPAPRTMESLTGKEFKHFQRTGQMPK